MQIESVNPYSDSRHKSEQVKDMFDSIAPAYDFMNRAMTFGIDKLWRRAAVKILQHERHDDILDIATGTGDLAIMIAKMLDPLSVIGVDLSAGMIEIGRKKVSEAGLDDIVSLGIGDCLQLPFTDNSFDCITCAYGVRNFQDLQAGYNEMHRVLRTGGIAVILELSTPRSPIVKPFYNLYTRHVIPNVGRLVSKDVRAYTYLPESIAAVPQGEQMTAIMTRAGFSDVKFIPMTFGTCTIYIGRK